MEATTNNNDLGAPMYSTPVVANGVVYFNSGSHLFAIEEPSGRMGTSSPARQGRFGMAIRQRLETMQGTIVVQSVPGHGTTVRISVPFDCPDLAAG